MIIRPARWACVGALVCALLATQALAATYIVETSNTVGQSFETASGAQLLDLGEGNGTALSVKTVAATARLLILFNAECSVAGLDDNDSAAVVILVNGVVAPGATIGKALCTSDGDGLLNSWVTAAADASTVVGPGTHTVSLRGSLNGAGVAGDDYRIDDLSLIVIVNEQ